MHLDILLPLWLYVPFFLVDITGGIMDKDVNDLPVFELEILNTSTPVKMTNILSKYEEKEGITYTGKYTLDIESGENDG